MNSKYFVQALLTLLMLTGFCTGAKATIYEVSTAADFIKHWTANDSIQLTADIDLSSFTDDDMVENYTAELSGVKDTSYVYTGKETADELEEHMCCYVIRNAPEMLAKELHGAYIHHVMFMDCKPDWSTLNTLQGTAVLARYSYNCLFSCVFLYRNEVNGETATEMSNDASCFVCQDDGSIFRFVHAYDCKAYCMYSYAGILAAEAKNSKFYDCSASYGCAVYADGTLDNSYVGGMVGEAKNVKFVRCENDAYVAGGKDCVGGVAGKSTNTTYRNCTNYGSVAITKYGNYKGFSETSDAMYSSLPNTLSCDEIEYSQYFREAKHFVEKISAGSISSVGAGTLKASELINWQNYRSLFFSKQVSHKVVHNLDPHSLFGDDSFEGTFSEDSGLSEPVVENAYTVQSYICMSVAVIMAAYQIAMFVYEAQDDDNVGGIVGLMDGGSASQCANYGAVYSADAYAGGIAGEARNNSPLIQNCLNQGFVKGYEQTGGIVGRIESGTINSCLNLGTVSNGNSSKDTFGRIYGEKSSDVKLAGNYYVGDTNKVLSDGCNTVTLQRLASGQVTLDLNEQADSIIWRQSIGIDYYPTLLACNDTVTAAKIQTNIDPTVRTKSASTFLKALFNQYSNIVLTDDINLNTSMFNFCSHLMPFHGSIDGQNHSLSNVRYMLPYTDDKLLNNDNSPTNQGLLSWTDGASFKNLVLNNFIIDYSLGWGKYCGLLVGHSDNSTYNNIHITGGSAIMTSTETYTMYHAGGLLGYSNHDTITNCSTGSNCSFEGNCSWNSESVYVGGLIGAANRSTIKSCYNGAKVTANNDYVGGIVADADSCNIEQCLNMGDITGEEQVGGIVGYGKDTNIKYCVNTGNVSGNATYFTDGEIGGIVGEYDIDKEPLCNVTECCNWGNVSNVAIEDNKHGIYGETNNTGVFTNNYWTFKCNGSECSNTVVEDVNSGKFTYDFNKDNGNIFYQDIDLNTFSTHYPVPIANAGVVYENYDCYGIKGYSNVYASTAEHSSCIELDQFGACNKCGSLHEAPAEIELVDKSDLCLLAYYTNKGQDFSKSVVTLTNDIDMKNLGCAPIGTETHPFSGEFNGGGHRIKNMDMYYETYAGLFGCVGTSNIHDVIVDSTCTIRSSAIGVAGIVGSVSSESGSTCNVDITRCGNEADIMGYSNAAGIVGGVYDNDNTCINITNCYNTGCINGYKESAAICGYGGKNMYINKTWNSGNVYGADGEHTFARFASDGKRLILDSYSIDDSQADVNLIEADNTADGSLCFTVNNSKWPGSESACGWYQRIGVDNVPTFYRSTTPINAVWRHAYCDNTYWYDNSDTPGIYEVTHQFNDDGICTYVAGEIHGEQPGCDFTNEAYMISKIGHLYWMANEFKNGNNSEDCELMNDIVVNKDVIVDGKLNTDTKAVKAFLPWTPIPYFEKTFYGNGHTVSGLYYDDVESADGVGLFGILNEGAKVENLGVTDSYFNVTANVGGIAGKMKLHNKTATINNCYATGIINAGAYAGGLVGAIESPVAPIISNCYSLCKVNFANNTLYPEFISTLGGLCGKIISTGDLAESRLKKGITNCYYNADNTNGTYECGTAKIDFDFSVGGVCALLNQGQDATAWSQPLETTKAPILGTDGITYTRQMSNQWGTVILPYPIYSDENIQLYQVDKCTISGDTGSLMLKPVDSIDANTPCFFKKLTEATSVNMPMSNDDEFTAPTSTAIESNWGDNNWYLTGLYSENSGIAGYFYYLAQDKIWYAERPVTVPVYRAILISNNSSSCKSLDICTMEDDDITKIGTITDGEINFDDSTIYDLSGQRLSQPQKGQVNIVNGKKVFVK